MSDFLTNPWIFIIILFLLIVYAGLSFLAHERSVGNRVDIFGGTLAVGGILVVLSITILCAFAISAKNSVLNDKRAARQTECATKSIPEILAKAQMTPSDINLVITQICK